MASAVAALMIAGNYLFAEVSPVSAAHDVAEAARILAESDVARSPEFAAIGVDSAAGAVEVYWAGPWLPGSAVASVAQRIAADNHVGLRVVHRRYSASEVQEAEVSLLRNRAAIEGMGFDLVEWGGVSSESDVFPVHLRPRDTGGDLTRVTALIRAVSLPDAQVMLADRDPWGDPWAGSAAPANDRIAGQSAASPR